MYKTHTLTERQKEIVGNLLTAFCRLQDAMEPLGLRPNAIEGCNELYDWVWLSLGNSPDGDNQERIFEGKDGDGMTYKEMVEDLRREINYLSEGNLDL